MNEKPYAVIDRPDHYGRGGWETYYGYQSARRAAAFYRYHYGHTSEVWTVTDDGELGRCIRRELPEYGTRFDYERTYGVNRNA